MPVFNGKTVPLGATHYTVSPGMRTRFMCRDPLLPSEWRGFYGEGWTAMETSLPINQLPYWALNPAEQEAHNKKTENRFLGFEITECPRKFFEYIATYGQATMKVDPGAGDHTVASLVRTSPLSVVWTSPFPKPTDSDKKLDAAIDKVKQATDDLVKARDAKPRVRMSAVSDPLCFDESGSISERALARIHRKVMTAKANGTPYWMWTAGGWTDEQLIEHGYMVAPVKSKIMSILCSETATSVKPINQGNRIRAKSATKAREANAKTVESLRERIETLQLHAKNSRAAARDLEKYTKPVKLCHLNIGDLFMVPETNMNVWQRSRWCGKLLQVITVPGENPAYTKGQFGLYGCQKSLRAMDMDTHEPLEMPCLSTLVWRC